MEGGRGRRKKEEDYFQIFETGLVFKVALFHKSTDLGAYSALI